MYIHTHTDISCIYIYIVELRYSAEYLDETADAINLIACFFGVLRKMFHNVGYQYLVSAVHVYPNKFADFSFFVQCICVRGRCPRSCFIEHDGLDAPSVSYVQTLLLGCIAS